MSRSCSASGSASHCSTKALPRRRSRCSCASLYFSVRGTTVGGPCGRSARRTQGASLNEHGLQSAFVDNAFEILGLVLDAVTLRPRFARQRADHAVEAARRRKTAATRNRHARAGAEFGLRHSVFLILRAKTAAISRSVTLHGAW